MNEIKPALTPEEWTKHGEGRARGWYSSAQGESPEKIRHRIAAEALHGQPFGFTWEDVRHLRGVAESLPEDTIRQHALFDLAGRIAALLPPR